MNHRKLISESETFNITSFCDTFCENTPGDCSQDLCYNNCSSYCPRVTIITVHHGSHKLLLESLIVSLSLIGLCCFIYCLLTLYKLYKNKMRPLQEGQETLDVDEFFDEEHGPILDHPIWYIRTVGLPSSTIDLITTIKYKSGEGLIEGTDCSVCLSEFEDDETLRLLPKCSHAFHLTCIDTWLRSHTNCPMCRAPILSNPNGALSPILEQNIEDDSVVENSQVVVSEGSELRESENVDLESKGVESSQHVKGDNGDEEIGEAQAMQRSASMDSLAASKTMDLGNGLKRFMGSCSFKKSLQKGPISMKRSVSCSGKDLFLRHNQDMNLVLPA